jgi:hypothetical protein
VCVCAERISERYAKLQPSEKWPRRIMRVSKRVCARHALYCCGCLSRAGCPVSYCSSRCRCVCNQRVFEENCSRAQSGPQPKRLASAFKCMSVLVTLLAVRAGLAIGVALRVLCRAAAHAVIVGASVLAF